MAEITLTVTGEGTHTDWTKVGALGIADTMTSDDDASTTRTSLREADWRIFSVPPT